MGLDITAMSNMQHVGRHPGTDDWPEGESWCENDDHYCAFAYADHHASTRGLLGMVQVNVVGEGFIGGDCYTTTEETEYCGFGQGYGGHSQFRHRLARLLGYEGQEDFWAQGDPSLPFWELVWFADNEGTIGPEAAADLLEDFRTHRQAFVKMVSEAIEEDYWIEKYDNWTRAFELASQHGLVSFH